MPDCKTVFVLGAGASYEFGLPVGETLKETISRLLRFKFDFSALKTGDGITYQAIEYIARESGVRDVNPWIQAAREISDAMPLSLSIDNYLHIHRGNKYVEQCGKLAIVRSILGAEAGSKLRYHDNEKLNFDHCMETWAIRLVRQLAEQCTLDELSNRLSKLTFIVFNYDRCLEHFLAHALAINYGISKERAGEFVNQMQIYHPYGIVGNLPWMKKPGIEVIDFGATPNWQQLAKLSQGIKTFTEGTDDEDSDILAIRRSFAEAERFVFLGYAYHPLNMKLLLGSTPKSNRTRTVYGTAFGMSVPDCNDVQAYLDNALYAPSAAIRRESTCYGLFHEFSRALSFV